MKPPVDYLRAYPRITKHKRRKIDALAIPPATALPSIRLRKTGAIYGQALNKYYPGRHPCQALSDSTPAKEDGGRLKVERQPDSLLPSFFILHPSAFILLRSSFIPHPSSLPERAGQAGFHIVSPFPSGWLRARTALRCRLCAAYCLHQVPARLVRPNPPFRGRDTGRSAP